MNFEKVILNKFKELPEEYGKTMSIQEIRTFFNELVSSCKLQDEDAFNEALENLISTGKINEIKDDSRHFFELVI